MKKTIVFTALLSLLFLTDSCQAIHRGIPKAKNRGGREVVLTDGETTVLRSVREADAPVAEAEAPFVAAVVPSLVESEPLMTDAPAIVVKPDLFNEDTVRVFSDDAEPSEEYMIDEALDSERSARNAYSFSFVPLSGLIFLPGLLIGVIGTLICLSNFNKFEFVTEKGLNDARRARNTVIATSLVVVALYVLFIALIIFLL
jgi:hypothetical protein